MLKGSEHFPCHLIPKDIDKIQVLRAGIEPGILGPEATAPTTRPQHKW